MIKFINYFHKYIGLVVLLQVLLWSIGGFLMSYLNFGDLYRNKPAQKINDLSKTIKLDQVYQLINEKYPDNNIISLSIKNIVGENYYQINLNKKPRKLLVSSEGEIITQFDEKVIAKIAEYNYFGDYKNTSSKIELLPSSKGNYYSSQPIYRVSFSDTKKMEFYIDPITGKLLAKRKKLWGFYNKMWELHLMKYTSNSSLNKFLLLFFSVLNVLVALTGFIKFFKMSSKVKTG